MIEEKQLPPQFRQVIETQLSVYNSKQPVQNIDHIPDIKLLTATDPPTWYHRNGAICVYVDMVGSTKMGTDLRKPMLARAYHWYVSTALHLFSEFGPQLTHSVLRRTIEASDT